jgi:hypothetical protein
VVQKKKSENAKWKKHKSINKHFKILVASPHIHTTPPRGRTLQKSIKKKCNCKTGLHLNKTTAAFDLSLFILDWWLLTLTCVYLSHAYFIKKIWPFETQNYICINTLLSSAGNGSSWVELFWTWLDLIGIDSARNSAQVPYKLLF